MLYLLPKNVFNQSSPSKVFTVTDLLCAPRSLTFFCFSVLFSIPPSPGYFFCDSESIKVPCPATDIKIALFFVAYLLAFKVNKNNSPFFIFGFLSTRMARQKYVQAFQNKTAIENPTSQVINVWALWKASSFFRTNLPGTEQAEEDAPEEGKGPQAEDATAAGDEADPPRGRLRRLIR